MFFNCNNGNSKDTTLTPISVTVEEKHNVHGEDRGIHDVSSRVLVYLPESIDLSKATFSGACAKINDHAFCISIGAQSRISAGETSQIYIKNASGTIS